MTTIKRENHKEVLVNDLNGLGLPEPIATYFKATNLYDEVLLATCFSDDCMLADEGKILHGPKAVCGHINKANRDANVKTELISYNKKNDETIVSTIISGSFDGSPVPLEFCFKLSNGKIKVLDIRSTCE